MRSIFSGGNLACVVTGCMTRSMAILVARAAALCLASATWQLSLAQGTPPAPTANSPERTVIIRAGALIDGTSPQPRLHQEILIRGDRIAAVYPAGSKPAPPGAALIDLGSATVLPGLIDTHTHVFLQGEEPSAGGYDVQLLKYPASFRVVRAVVAAKRALDQGFTTIRDVETEGAGYGDVGIQKAINEGYIPGPRMFVATRAISSTGGYSLDDYAPEITVPKGAQIIDGPVEARKAAREQLDHGADWIKVYMTHRSWVDAAGELVSQPTLTVEELQAVVDEAHGWRRKVACHAYNGPGLQRALDGGCDSIEHGLELTDAQIAQMVKQGTWYVPTLAVYYYDLDPPDTASGKRDRKRIAVHGVSFRKALAAGVKMAFGTDVGGFVWTDPIAQEFEREVEFGMTPMQAIQSATSKAADLLDKRGELGVVAPGAFADLVAVPGDPLKDITLLKQVRFVMKAGNLYKSDLSHQD
jgi:imidazolonepropionase-like amidohydrolase